MATKRKSTKDSLIDKMTSNLTTNLMTDNSGIDWSQYINNYPSVNTSSSGIYNGYSNFVNYDLEKASLEEFVVYLKEEELVDILDRILASANENEFKRLVRTIVRTRHFSENFLSKYLKYLRKIDILKMHEADIKSNSYATICLYFETQDDKGDDNGPFSSYYSIGA